MPSCYEHSAQSPRPLSVLAEYFPKGYSVFYKANTETCPEANQYSKALVDFYTQELNQAEDTNLTLGQMGLGDGVSLLLLWQSLLQCRKNNPELSRLKVHLLIFEPHAISALELKQLWQALGLFDANSPVAPQAEQFIAGKMAQINGAQRFILEQGQLRIDVHFGDLHSNLTELMTPEHRVTHWHCLPHIAHTQTEFAETQASQLQFNQVQSNANQLNQAILWQMGRLSQDNASLYLDGENFKPSASDNNALTDCTLIKMATQAGFSRYSPNLFQASSDSCNAIPLGERRALRQQQENRQAHCPVPNSLGERRQAVNNSDSIAIIGGGIAGACLALSLAERGKAVTLYCKDDKLGDGATGNRQGAIYPLLTPENSHLSQFFQQAFLFSRRRLLALLHEVYPIGHQLCGVLQTGFDERSEARLEKIIQGQHWPEEIAYAVSPEQASALAGVSIDKPGFYYPNGGWICPFEFARACLEKAKSLANVEVKLNSTISCIKPLAANVDSKDASGCTSQASGTLWGLYHQGEIVGSHQQVVLASGASITAFEQTQALQMSGFRGQVSHVPSKGELAKLNTVICANGYLTPAFNSTHCVGASYVKDPEHLDFCSDEQAENGQKMQQSFPNLEWPQDIDVSDRNARVGVRMVTRDHFPMMGCAPDIEEIISRYQTLNASPQASQNNYAKQCQQYWQQTPAPVHHNLFVLGGLGSRGLSSAPLAAECLAAQLCGEIAPISATTLALLNPNRMWMRKLLKGKALC
ncbi:FAD dependent oxidoreductase [Shewanella denitrificans OS217]|uniref:tRNA 5-methylaminomethyl-2-thiouridine biosynthesis bifunctional protein MnmC n=1 Tax=Shewanella denitrificans (strain OS217 / ATCC BAA-1090 / DSM 15013) TaxID=318161 RepID=MNMC_SHEDO|nr:FAD-dependent 5-carboxymethylaminomethyl-2-thiouridine(34) oxidoreductase MnmC [Shewanella denitrificans]Q12P60.1 RecName: Full=tRNA 5-methylaminomethyl-2-thiouridine biosynthesis bifunctional protein MnmC; Short=tRNA mnm(5)s(2)U biosynthesis bifunctional protein; Includes: RecName: Full=tRNA (mnm(5)s(2)U34)-methyltransferase; Includes: RecName: Full=FAD-dependent cmnm(5)s(2)U34 oxidoreductase [Shewanella denitrificans OS217]ABE54766.1 FAD dependent oxidoreductase [Shewanella denitrificans OS2